MNDSENFKTEDLLDMMEKMQDQLGAQMKKYSEALETISSLSSENSKLRNELQKKSETIVSLNGKIETLSKSDLDLKKSKEILEAGTKAKNEAEAMRSACEEERKILSEKKSELDAWERKVSSCEANLSREITTKAEEITKEKRESLEQEYKKRGNEMESSYEKRESLLSNQYKKMTVAHKAEFTALLIYGLISTVMQVLTTPIIVEEFISFFRGLWNGVTGYIHLANNAGKGMASIADYISNPSASTILHGLLYIVVAGTIIGVAGLGILYIGFAYWDYLQECIWDRHTVIAIVVILAVTIFLSEDIASLIPLNLLLIQILMFLTYSGIRAWIHHKKESKN